MKTKISPYLFFPGNCEEAVGFYMKALGAKLEYIMRYAQAGTPIPVEKMKPGNEDRILHAILRVGDSIIMTGDSDESGEKQTCPHALSLDVTDANQARGYFDALSQEGEITIPLGETFWSPLFGAVRDRYGIVWMVNVVSPECFKAL